MECKYRLYQVNHHFLNIKIYPEWNVKVFQNKEIKGDIKIKIYPEWNVNNTPSLVQFLNTSLKSTQSGM